MRLLVLAFLIPCTLTAGPNRLATANQHLWLMYFGDHKISPRLGIHLEAQLRRADLCLPPNAHQSFFNRLTSLKCPFSNTCIIYRP